MNVAELWRRHTRGVDCCDFAQLVKVYRAPREGQQRYSTATLFRSPPVMACSVPLGVALQAECRLLPASPPKVPTLADSVPIRARPAEIARPGTTLQNGEGAHPAAARSGHRAAARSGLLAGMSGD